MKKYFVMLGLFILILLFCVGILVLSIFIEEGIFSSFKLPEDLELKEKMVSVISESDIIDFNDITDFEWDEMYIAFPYISPKDVLKKGNIV